MGRKGAGLLRLPPVLIQRGRIRIVLLLSEVSRIWDSAFLLAGKMTVPHPLVGTLNSLVQPLQNALTAGG